MGSSMKPVVKEIITASMDGPFEPQVAESPDETDYPSGVGESIAFLFGLRSNQLSPKQHDWLNQIVEWANANNAQGLSVSHFIERQQDKLGAPRMGIQPLDHFYRWLATKQNFDRAKAALDISERNYGRK